MSMYFVGIDISKYKHDCCIISAADQQIVSKFTVKNDKDGFEHLLTTLNSLSNPEDIKIGFESTAHYALNLELFLENAHHSFMDTPMLRLIPLLWACGWATAWRSRMTAKAAICPMRSTLRTTPASTSPPLT